MTAPDPFAEVRAEFVAGLARRVETMRSALAALDGAFHAEQAEALYRAAHSLSGTAASFGVEDLADAAGDLEQLARVWLERGVAPADERRAADAALKELDGAARAYRATAVAGGGPSAAAPPAGGGGAPPPDTTVRHTRAQFTAAPSKVGN